MARSTSGTGVLRKVSPRNGNRSDRGRFGRIGAAIFNVSLTTVDGGLQGVSFGNQPSSESGLGGLGGSAIG